jgi:hypothetical protein
MLKIPLLPSFSDAVLVFEANITRPRPNKRKGLGNKNTKQMNFIEN